MTILLSVISYLGNIYHCCSSLLKTNMLTGFNAVITAFYSICTGGEGGCWKSTGLYVLKLKMGIFPLESNEGAARSCQLSDVANSKADRFFSYIWISCDSSRQLTSLTSLLQICGLKWCRSALRLFYPTFAKLTLHCMYSRSSSSARPWARFRGKFNWSHNERKDEQRNQRLEGSQTFKRDP